MIRSPLMVRPIRGAYGPAFLRGARSGAKATGTMTAVFGIFERLNWLGQLPPRQVTDRLMPNAPRPVTTAASGLSHVSYGALIGAGFAVLAPRVPGLLSTAGGAVFGLAVCLANYEGLLPLLRIRPPLHHDSRREIAALLIAHLVYGGHLGRDLARQLPGGQEAP